MLQEVSGSLIDQEISRIIQWFSRGFRVVPGGFMGVLEHFRGFQGCSGDLSFVSGI